jgi:hypothetical protein
MIKGARQVGMLHAIHPLDLSAFYDSWQDKIVTVFKHPELKSTDIFEIDGELYFQSIEHSAVTTDIR